VSPPKKTGKAIFWLYRSFFHAAIYTLSYPTKELTSWRLIFRSAVFSSSAGSSPLSSSALQGKVFLTNLVFPLMG